MNLNAYIFNNLKGLKTIYIDTPLTSHEEIAADADFIIGAIVENPEPIPGKISKMLKEKINACETSIPPGKGLNPFYYIF